MTAARRTETEGSTHPGEPVKEGLEERWVRARDEVELRYWVGQPAKRSEGTLLLLHGAASNHTRWSEFVADTRLRESRRILAPDLRGNGASMFRGRLDLEGWCEDLLTLLNAEGVDAAVVAGHSLGAQVALFLAHRAPARVRGLVLVDPLFRNALGGRRRWTSRLGPLYRLAALKVRCLNRLGLRRREIPNRDLRELDRQTRALLAEGRREELVKKYSSIRLILRYMPTANYLQQAAEMFRPPPPFEEIAAPVLVLLSSGSSFSDHAAVRREVDRFPQAEIVEIPAHHWPLTETPDATREAIEEWISRRYPDRLEADHLGGGPQEAGSGLK